MAGSIYDSILNTEREIHQEFAQKYIEQEKKH